MPLVQAFRAIRYNPARFPDLTPLLTPPYDVISEQEQAACYARHPHNMIRLDLGQILPADSDADNRYVRSAHSFAQWRREQILIQDQTPALYPSSIRYALPTGQVKTLMGVFALVKLEPFDAGHVLPHEMTFSAAKEDRLHLMRASRASFSPIFLISPDPDGRLRPLLEQSIPRSEAAGSARPSGATEGDNQPLQQLWRLTDPAMIDEITAVLAKHPLLIADGHHRYETALNYRNEVAGSAAGASANFCLAFIAASHDPGLSIQPTHRVVARLPNFDLPSFCQRLGDRFSIAPQTGAAVQDLQAAMERSGQTQPVFGLITPSGASLLTYRRPAGGQLDVRILQSEILEALLQLQEEEAVAGGRLRYVKDAQEAARLVQAGEAQLAFLLNPTPIEAIEAIAHSGGRMPRKTTYFLPKPLTGFAIYPLD